MFFRHRIAIEDDARSTLSPAQHTHMERYAAHEAEQALKFVAARHFGIRLKVAIFLRARSEHRYTLALMRRADAAFDRATPQHQALAAAILERYRVDAPHHGWLPVEHAVWLDGHARHGQAVPS